MTYFQVIDVFVDALRGIGVPIRNVHNEDYGDEGFWYRTPVALKDGVRRGTFRDKIQSTFKEIISMIFVKNHNKNSEEDFLEVELDFQKGFRGSCEEQH